MKEKEKLERRHGVNSLSCAVQILMNYSIVRIKSGVENKRRKFSFHVAHLSE